MWAIVIVYVSITIVVFDSMQIWSRAAQVGTLQKKSRAGIRRQWERNVSVSNIVKEWPVHHISIFAAQVN